MKIIWTTELSRSTDHWLDMALLKPVAITPNGRESSTQLLTEFKRLMRRDHKVFHVDSLSDAQRQEMNYLVSKSEFAKSATSKQAMAFGAAILDAYAPKAIASQAQQGIINRRSELKAG